MRVTLIDFTGSGHDDPSRWAAAVLIFAKSTRLQMSPSLFDEIMEGWSEELINQELKYIANTIPSSWEFCEYTFLVEGVSRAFTHQFVRNRHASFAQQTMRVLDVDGWTYETGPSIAASKDLTRDYETAMRRIDEAYRHLIKQGAKIEDARGVLPTNIHTNIMMKCNLRSLTETVRKRASSRTQGEYRNVLDEMKRVVKSAHPWASLFFERSFDKAASDLDRMIQELPDSVPAAHKTTMIKLLDQMRAE